MGDWLTTTLSNNSNVQKSTGSVGGTKTATTGDWLDQTISGKPSSYRPNVKALSTDVKVSTTPQLTAQQKSAFSPMQTYKTNLATGFSNLVAAGQDVVKKISGIFTPKDGEPMDIVLPKQSATIPTFTQEQISAIGDLKVGQKIPGFDLSTNESSSAKLVGNKQVTFGNVIDNVFNKPTEYVLNNTGFIGDSIKQFASDLYNNPVATFVPAIKQIEKNPEIKKRLQENPIYKFETEALQGVMEGALRVYANWNPKVESFLDQKITETGQASDVEIAGNTVGQIIGTIGSFILGGEVVAALKWGKAALPATFAALGQTSLPADTPMEARVRNLIIDTVSGTLLEYIKPLQNIQKMGKAQKAIEYTKQLTKSMSVMSGQIYLDARSVGATNEQALEMVKNSALIMLGLHGFMIAGKAGQYAVRSKFKEGSAVFTPEQARSIVVGSDIEGTKLGNAIMKASMEAEAQGKSIRLDMVAAKKSKIAGALNLETPNGIAITKIEYVDGVQTPKIGSVEAPGSTKPATPTPPAPKAPTTPVKRGTIKAEGFPEGVSGVATIKPDGTAGLSVHLNPEMQSKGYGTKVVRQLEDKLISQGIKTINISADLHEVDGGKSSVGFWEKMGFTKNGDPKGDFQPMTKQLEDKQESKSVKETLNRNGVDIGKIIYRVDGKKLYVDEIIIDPPFREKGYATEELNKIKEKVGADEVIPVDVQPESQGFWDKYSKKETPSIKNLIKVPKEIRSATESKAFDKISSDPQGVISEYEKSFDNEMSPDLALTVLPGYDGANASELSRATGLVKTLVYDDLLKTQQGINNNAVYISAGGSGSGKTSGIRQSKANLKDEYAVILDTTFSSNSAIKDVQKALDNGYDVAITFTFRDPFEAWQDGALKRIGEEGRVVPEAYFLQSHIDAQKNIIKAYKKYKDNEKVDFHFIHNKNDRSFPDTTIDKISEHLYDRQTLAKQISKATDKAYEEKRITKKQYETAISDRATVEGSGQGKPESQPEREVSGVEDRIGTGEKSVTADPSHPWYYKSGKKPLSVSEIKTEARRDVMALSEDEFGQQLESYLPSKSINQEALDQLWAVKDEQLKADVTRYEEIVKNGLGALTDNNPTEEMLHTALSLTHNHVYHDEYILALIDRQINPGVMSDYLPVEPKQAQESIALGITRGGEVEKLYSGSETDLPSGKYLYLTPDKKYASEFGKNITEYEFEPKNSLDLRDLGEKQITFSKLKSIMAENGIEIDSSMVDPDYRTGVSDAAWFWLRRYQNLIDVVKEAGKDSILLKESIGNSKKKNDSVIVLDDTVAKRLQPSRELIMAPTEAVTPEEVMAEASNLGLPPHVIRQMIGGVNRGQVVGYVRPRIGKAELKILAVNNKEFQANPVLIVDENKNLTFTGEKSRFLIKPEALQISTENISPGDEIKLDLNKLTGKTQQMRIKSGSGETLGYAPKKEIDPLFEEAKKHDTFEAFEKALDEGQAGLTVDYTPLKRLLESNIGNFSLANVGFDPETVITVYRGIDDTSVDYKIGKMRINPGDYVATTRELAESYAATPDKVVEKKIKAKDFYLDNDPYIANDFKGDFSPEKLEEVSLEGVYNPNKPITQKELQAIWNRAHAPSVSENLGFNPKNIENPLTPKATEEMSKLIKQSEIAKYLSEKFNVPIRRGKFRMRGAIGIYKGRPKVIRYKSGGLGTVFHEVAHYLDDTMTLSETINAEEVEKLVVEYGNPPKDSKRRRKEAFAEYMRFKMTGQNEKIAEYAPEFDKAFTERINGMPEVKDVLDNATDNFRRWNEQPATSKILSQLSIGNQNSGKFIDTVSQKMHELYSAALDDLHPLSEFSKIARKNLGDVKAIEDPYILARNLRGWVGKADLFLNTGTFRKEFWKVDDKGKTKMNFTGKSYAEIMEPVEKKNALDDFRVYIVAQRIVNDLAPREIVTGIDPKDAQTALDELNKKYPEFEAIAKERREYKDRLLDFAADNGLIGQEGLKKIREANKFHVPFYRVMEEAGAKFLGKTKIAGNFGSPIKRMKGSDREIIDPLESDVKDTYAIINAAERNNIGIAMANIASRHFELGRLFEEVVKPMKPVTVKVDEVLKQAIKDTDIDPDDIPEDLGEAVVTLFRPTYATGANMLNVNMGDKQKVFEVDPDLFRAIQGLELEDVGIIMKILSIPATVLRAGATLSPDFSVRNPLRDQFTAFAYSKYGFIPGVDLVRGMFELFRKGDTYNLWKAGGGEHAMFVSLDRLKLQKNLEEVMSDKNLKNTVIDVVKNPLKMLQVLSEIGEAGTRLGEMRNAIARHANPIEAAYASRNITLDFSRIGSKTRAINAIIAFFNSNLQGTDTMVRSFKEKPFRTLWKVLLGLTLPSILLYFANRKDPRWKEIPQWQKNLFWIVMTPNHVWRIPKPFELGVLFGSVPERILEVMDTKDPEMFNELGNAIASGFTPGMLPTTIIPIIENITNYSFFLDRPIVSRGKENLPPPQQSGTYTTELSKILGEALNYSPAKIDNLINGYTGGLGKYAVTGIDKILTGTGIVYEAPAPATKMEELPIIKAFMIRPPIGTGSESVNRLYNMYAKTSAQMTYVRQLSNSGKGEEAVKYLKDHPDTINSVILTQVVNTFSEMNKAVDLIRQSPTMSPEDKAKKIDDLQALQTDLAQKALEDIKKRK